MSGNEHQNEEYENADSEQEYEDYVPTLSSEEEEASPEVLDRHLSQKEIREISNAVSRSIKEANFEVVQVSLEKYASILSDRDPAMKGKDFHECMGCAVNISLPLDRSPLHFAYREDFARWLIEHGANIWHQDTDGNSPMHCLVTKAAMKEGMNPEAVCALIRRSGGYINQHNKEGNTPLHLACKFGNIRMVKWLLKNGAKVQVLNVEGKSPKILVDERKWDKSAPYEQCSKELMKYSKASFWSMFSCFAPERE